MSTSDLIAPVAPLEGLNLSAVSSSDSDEKKTVEAEVPKPEETSAETVIPFATESEDEVYDVKSGLPLPDVSAEHPVETSQLTFRAVIVGCLLGAIVQASNLYLGLKTGFTFGAQLFGCLFGYAMIKPMSRWLPPKWGGGYFGEKENVTVQTAATAAGGLSSLFTSGIPALYRMHLLGQYPIDDIGRLFTFTACCAFYGMCFAIPLRKWYILKQKLVFPTPTATALTIRSLHSGVAGAAKARLKSIMLLWAFCGSTVYIIVSSYAKGILTEWHFGWWMTKMGAPYAIRLDNYGFFWTWSPAFLGAGVLSGPNASFSFYGGYVFAWGIMAPILIATKTCSFKVLPYAQDAISIGGMSYIPGLPVSPQYWLMWSGISLMLFGSFADIICCSSSIVEGCKSLGQSTLNAIARFRKKTEKYVIVPSLDDPCPPEDQVPVWVWATGLTVSILATVLVMRFQFDTGVGVSILSIVCGFIFSFIGVQCAGDTDINPITTCAKATQFVVGGATQGQHLAIDAAMKVNVLGALVAAAAASQTTDMTGDLKTGHLLKAKPKVQFYAQTVGALISVFLSVALFILFTIAYPCIIAANASQCEFDAPSVAVWEAVARVVTSTNGLPFPNSSAFFALACAAITIGVSILKNFYVPEDKRCYVPNLVAAGLGFILHGSPYPAVMAVGALGAMISARYRPALTDLYMYPLAAGGIAGEGIAGVVIAVLVIAGIDGSKVGTSIGCLYEQPC